MGLCIVAIPRERERRATARCGAFSLRVTVQITEPHFRGNQFLNTYSENVLAGLFIGFGPCHCQFMGSQTTNQSARVRKRPGRPRLLSTEQVLDAAIELGLEGLTMATLAKRLGVSPGMIYGYVANREELIELASERVGKDYDYPLDTGQHWTVYAAENAVAWFRFFTGPGEFLMRYLNGQSGPASEIDRTTFWLAAMRDRGFEPERALLLQRQMGEIVMGGALTQVRNRSLQDVGEQLSSALAARGADEDYEGLRIYAVAAQEPVWHISLIELLRAAALEREEAFDAHAVGEILKEVIYSKADGPHATVAAGR